MSKPVMEKIGIFGGTFNPVHNGHVLLARHYVQALGLQKLLVIPAKTPPHKLAPELAAEQLRLQMCALAFADLPQAQVSDLEICRPGKSYTIDTVYKLRQLYPQAQLYLLVGRESCRRSPCALRPATLGNSAACGGTRPFWSSTAARWSTTFQWRKFLPLKSAA